jgi:HD-GYP domain-containing protein (c-di-GMP phosphodiesterase class II)
MSEVDDLTKQIQELEVKNRRYAEENRTYQMNLESLVKARTEQLQATVRDLERSYDITLEALGEALDLKDGSTEGHSKRVCLFAIAIGQALALSREDITVMARAAFLHDIGKMAIPDQILLKPGALNTEEITIVHQHAFYSYEIVKKYPSWRVLPTSCIHTMSGSMAKAIPVG